MCVFSSHPFWTISSLDVPAGVTQEEGQAGFLVHLFSAVRALTFLARRIQSFLSLVDREVEFCVSELLPERSIHLPIPVLSTCPLHTNSGFEGGILIDWSIVTCRHHSFGTTLRFTGPVPADSRQ